MDWVFLRAMFAAYQIRVETDKFRGVFAVPPVKNLGAALPQSKKPRRGSTVVSQHDNIIGPNENIVKPVVFGSTPWYNVFVEVRHSPVARRRTAL